MAMLCVACVPASTTRHVDTARPPARPGPWTEPLLGSRSPGSVWGQPCSERHTCGTVTTGARGVTVTAALTGARPGRGGLLPRPFSFPQRRPAGGQQFLISRVGFEVTGRAGPNTEGTQPDRETAASPGPGPQGSLLGRGRSRVRAACVGACGAERLRAGSGEQSAGAGEGRRWGGRGGGWRPTWPLEQRPRQHGFRQLTGTASQSRGSEISFTTVRVRQGHGPPGAPGETPPLPRSASGSCPAPGPTCPRSAPPPLPLTLLPPSSAQMNLAMTRGQRGPLE